MFRIYFSKRKFESTRRLYNVLNSIPGVGQNFILGLFRKLGIPYHALISDLNPLELQEATKSVANLCTFEDLTRIQLRILKFHKNIGTYRGLRIRQGLPRNGQRTHSNAKNPRKLRGRLF